MRPIFWRAQRGLVKGSWLLAGRKSRSPTMADLLDGVLRYVQIDYLSNRMRGAFAPGDFGRILDVLPLVSLRPRGQSSRLSELNLPSASTLKNPLGVRPCRACRTPSSFSGPSRSL